MIFTVPSQLEASHTPEERGLRRDGVRLMVARRHDESVAHHTFADLPRILDPGDVLVVNTSATLPAAIPARVDGVRAELHLSTRLPAGLWTVELRHKDDGDAASTPWLDAPSGAVVELPDGGRAQLLVPAAGPRLWVTKLELPTGVLEYLAAHGRPIRYGYIDYDRPISAYQNVFADEPGSAEMPSAARPFSAELVTRLVARGIAFAPFVLHCGVSSPEAHEPPYAEWYRVGEDTAGRINAARRQGHRVVAVGTTAVRALETVVDGAGKVRPGEGWTEVIVTPERGVTAVDGLITGWHEPEASHLQMLEAIAGVPLLEVSYTAALSEGYLWHEFGDSHLILP